MIEQTLHYGDLRIPYRVAFVRDKKLAIHVYPDGQVCVDAPRDVELPEIKSAVLLRARWISFRLSQIEAQIAHVLPRQYVSGESHLYLGKRHLLKVVQRKQAEPLVKLLRGRIQVIAGNTDAINVRSMLWDWYRIRAQEVFGRRLGRAENSLVWLRQMPQWRLLTMKKQWGSCSPGGVLNLNPHLVKAPMTCIDYVILHELCHLRFHNHSPGFYRLLAKHMPEWEVVKQRLDGMAEVLLNV